MARQSLLFIAAEVADTSIGSLKALLESMTTETGRANPNNGLVPFGEIKELHLARFVVLEDPSLQDRVGITHLAPSEATRLALIANGDGTPNELIDRFAEVASKGLAQIFGYCDRTVTPGLVADWMRRHQVRAAATYDNWPGRSANQIREEATLHQTLLSEWQRQFQKAPDKVSRALKTAARNIKLTPIEKPNLAERLADIGHWLLLPALAIPLAPILLTLSPLLIWMLRSREKSDPVIAPRPSPERNRMLSSIEDHDVANQYGAIGTLKPGWFRLWLAIIILWAINWAARHLYRRGRLGRVNTIHFASWTFLDDKRRVFFASNYDGSREAYNDDFINKVAFGLNLSFSNGLGYPHTDWLVLGGARHEQDFKRYLFHHQIPTQVWYNAFPGLTTYDMARNARLRRAFEAESIDLPNLLALI